ncbi:MAG: hypothetical protein AB1427_00825 [Thermodesulfobacteriota bacterium]
MDFDWKKIIKTVAPTLATALGGPLAGMAVTTIATALGIDSSDPKQAESEIAKAVMSGNPEILLKLKQADQDFQVRLRELDIDLEKIYAEDRKSARDMRTAMKDKFPDFLTALVTIGFFAVLAVHFFHAIPEGNQTFLNIMLGSLGTVWVDQIRFYFGSSKGSKTKEEMLAAKQ